MAETLKNPDTASFSIDPPDHSRLLQLIEQIVATRESRQLIADLVPALLKLWAESGTGAGATRKAARKSIAGLAGGSIKNAFLDSRGLNEAPRIRRLVSDPDFVRTASGQTGRTLDSIFSSLKDILTDIEALPADQKAGLAGRLLTDLGSGRSAPLITSVCRTINDIHQQDPFFLSKVLEPGLANWISGLDFGEVKELLDSASPGVSAVVAMINTLLWKYPAKLVTALSLLPPAINMLLDALTQTIKTTNENSAPDLVADLVLALFRETRPDTLAGLINELAEITRKFNTGSALIGEPGSPQLPNDIFALLNETLALVDGPILGKAACAMAEIKEAAACAMADALANHPHLMADGLKSGSVFYNARIRAVHHRLKTMEAMTPVSLNEALMQAVSHFDAQETAETLTDSAAMANTFLTAAAESVTAKTAEFSDALDPYEVSELVARLAQLTGESLKPFGRAVIPHLVKGILATLQPHDDEFEEAAESARNMLLSFLTTQEAPFHE